MIITGKVLRRFPIGDICLVITDGPECRYVYEIDGTFDGTNADFVMELDLSTKLDRETVLNWCNHDTSK